ncbi:indolepyruvate ferredoxin oxidoreductase family protein [Nonomuraea wenchangensis]|uniref:indolepyruvate ferredoxin oxidoreductase family protein n=1 Tax=Nonomuraea wenchangensis TaxID=568860 RepID=UPI00331E9014
MAQSGQRQAPGRNSAMTEISERVTPKDRYAATTGLVQLTGVQALARLPIEQHRRDRARGRRVATFVSGYEGSPLAGYDLELHRQRRLLEASDVVFLPGLNEESAATAVQGSQLAGTFDDARYDGVLGIWYGKAPGLDRATDALRHGNLMGAHPDGGALVLVGDDPAAKSSSVPSSSEPALADLAMPILYPADSQEVLDLGRHAVELSRASGLWVALKIVTAVADGSSTVTLGDDRPEPLLPPGAGRHRPTARLLQPTLGPLERDLVTVRLRLAREYSRLNRLNRIVGAGERDRVGVVAAGRTYLDVAEALRRLGIDEPGLADGPVRLLRVGMPFPLEAETVREFAEGLDEIVVVEEKRSFLESAVRDLLYGGPAAPRITGKHDADGSELIPAYGELDVGTVLPGLRRRLAANGVPVAAEAGAPVPAGRRLPLLRRAPYFCSGCPHNTSTKPAGASLVGGGIGCHAMVVLMDESQVGEVTGLTQMGGEGLQWLGMVPFVERGHYVQNLGDGTFDHSGSLAIRAAVAAGAHITYKLLHNAAVAMTGGQRPVGGMSVAAIVDVLLAEGVSRIIVTTEDLRRYRRVRLPRGVAVWDRSRIAEAQRVLAGTPGVTVLLHDQECATEIRRRRRRGLLAEPATRVFVNERVCEGCGDCGAKSNCLSVQPVPTEYGRKTRIHQTSCNVDRSCLDGDCPAFMTVTPGRRVARQAEPLEASALPEPEPVTHGDVFGIRLLGIGGTGVVTVSQVLATAGLLAGWHVRSLDQTGLAQKGGAVVSDVKLSRRPLLTTNRLAEGECDLYLGCDLLVAADAGNLAVASPERTVAVLSTSEVPTGRMVADPTVAFPSPDEVTGPVLDRVRPGHARLLDARAVSAVLFGDDQYANVLLVGVAYQQGAIPLPAEAIEEAIRLNGVAVETNLQAFRRGRQLVSDPAAVAALSGGEPGAADPPGGDVTGTVRAEPGSELARLVALRSGELVAYQDLAYARRYTAVVERVRAGEAAKAPGSGALAEAVARQLFKLMAYKDEYEVARLSLLPEVGRAVEEQFGPGARASWRLHPPLLRAAGLRGKLTLGPWFRPALALLRAGRRLRGTPFDPFGRTEVRRLERELAREYADLAEHLAARLGLDNLDLAVRIAGLPDMVRGYEDVKLRNVARYREELAALRARFDAPDQERPR